MNEKIEPQLNQQLNETQFSVSPTSYHAHTGVDSPQVDSRNLFYYRQARVITQSATPAINTDRTSVAHITGLAQAITSFTTNLTGSPQSEDLLRIDITDDGTARAITWGSKFENSNYTSLPTTTPGGQIRIDCGFVYNDSTGAWRIVALS